MQTPLLHLLTPFPRIIFAVLLILSCFIILFLAGLLLVPPFFGVGIFDTLELMSDFDNPTGVTLLKYFQILYEFGVFIIPPLLAAWFFTRKPFSYLNLDQPGRIQIWGLTLLIMASSIPFIDFTISLNEAMRLPSWLGNVEAWMQESEEQATKLTETFLNIQTGGGFLMNFLIIAILPAIGEELLFRGLFQRLFYDWTKNIHVAVILAGFLFGAMHLQFYGILPRTLLGILFGYLCYWSGSLWIPIFAHFLNNGAAVIVSFLQHQGQLSVNPEEPGFVAHPGMIIGSLIMTGLLMYVSFRISHRRNPKVP